MDAELKSWAMSNGYAHLVRFIEGQVSESDPTEELQAEIPAELSAALDTGELSLDVVRHPDNWNVIGPVLGFAVHETWSRDKLSKFDWSPWLT